jgi:hypothetical protein
MRRPNVVGSLLCWGCPSQRITLGTIPEETDKFYNAAGELVSEVTHPAQDVGIPSVLRDVIGEWHGLYKLACGHQRAGLPLLSNQEWLTLSDGQIARGCGIAEFRARQ